MTEDFPFLLVCSPTFWNFQWLFSTPNCELYFTLSVVSFIPNLSFYDKYTFSISLEEYNEYKNISLFENTKKLIFLESPDDNPITFQYEEKDLENDQMVTRTFSIKALATGEFACSLSSHGHDRGYQSETVSDARISFLVEN